MANQIAKSLIDEDGLEESVQFPDEGVLVAESDKEKWKLYFDGVANVYGCGTEAVLVSPKESQFPASIKLTFPYINNITEHEACIMGLKMIIDMEFEVLEVFRDSSLFIFSTQGEFKTKDPKLVSYHQHPSELIQEFKEVSFVISSTSVRIDTRIQGSIIYYVLRAQN